MNMECQSTRLPGLDGLRGVSILLVLMLHSVWYQHLHLPDHAVKIINQATFPLGTFGVPIFFVISGFLITYLLLREEARNGKISLKGFWVRRFFRIVPPVAIYVSCVGVYAYYAGVGVTTKDFLAVLFFFRNLVGGVEITAHFWSLSLEEQFYLFWPLALFFAPRPWRLKAAIFLLAAFPVMRIVSVVWLLPSQHVFVMNLVRFDFILMGCVLALLWKAHGYIALSRMTGDKLFISGSILIVAAWWLSFQSRLFPCFGNMTTLSDVLQQELITLQLGMGVCAIMIALATNSTQLLGGKLLNFPLLSGIGAISYSLYLWQQFFFFAPNLPHFMMYLPVRMVCSLGVAAASYYFVERPFTRLRHKIGSTGGK